MNITTYELTKLFCNTTGQLPATELDFNEDVLESESLLRISLIFEEFLELLESLGVEEERLYDFKHSYKNQITKWGLNLSKFDKEGVADALGDLDVVINNAGYFFGINMPEVAKRIYQSNMTKVCKNLSEVRESLEHYRSNGIPVSYREVVEGSWIVFNSETQKILKPLSYIPVNLEGTY